MCLCQGNERNADLKSKALREAIEKARKDFMTETREKVAAEAMKKMIVAFDEAVRNPVQAPSTSSTERDFKWDRKAAIKWKRKEDDKESIGDEKKWDPAKLKESSASAETLSKSAGEIAATVGGKIIDGNLLLTFLHFDDLRLAREDKEQGKKLLAEAEEEHKMWRRDVCATDRIRDQCAVMANNDLTSIYLKMQAEDAYQGDVGKAHPNHRQVHPVHADYDEAGDENVSPYEPNADAVKSERKPFEKLSKEQRTEACRLAVDRVGDWLQADKVLLMQALINKQPDMFKDANLSTITQYVSTAASRYELLDATDNLPSEEWIQSNFRGFSEQWNTFEDEAKEGKMKATGAAVQMGDLVKVPLEERWKRNLDKCEKKRSTREYKDDVTRLEEALVDAKKHSVDTELQHRTEAGVVIFLDDSPLGMKKRFEVKDEGQVPIAKSAQLRENKDPGTERIIDERAPLSNGKAKIDKVKDALRKNAERAMQEARDPDHLDVDLKEIDETIDEGAYWNTDQGEQQVTKDKLGEAERARTAYEELLMAKEPPVEPMASGNNSGTGSGNEEKLSPTVVDSTRELKFEYLSLSKRKAYSYQFTQGLTDQSACKSFFKGFHESFLVTNHTYLRIRDALAAKDMVWVNDHKGHPIRAKMEGEMHRRDEGERNGIESVANGNAVNEDWRAKRTSEATLRLQTRMKDDKWDVDTDGLHGDIMEATGEGKDLRLKWDCDPKLVKDAQTLEADARRAQKARTELFEYMVRGKFDIARDERVRNVDGLSQYQARITEAQACGIDEKYDTAPQPNARFGAYRGIPAGPNYPSHTHNGVSMEATEHMKAAEVAKKTMDALGDVIRPLAINRLVKEVDFALQALMNLAGSDTGAPDEITDGRKGLADAESARAAWIEVVACLAIRVQDSDKINKVKKAIETGETWGVSSGEPRVRQAQVEENGPSKSGKDDMRELEKLLDKMEACKKARDALTTHTGNRPHYESGGGAHASRQAKAWYNQVDGLINTARDCEVEDEHTSAAATAKSATFDEWRSGTQQAVNTAVSALRSAHQTDLQNNSIESLSSSQFNGAVSTADDKIRAAKEWDNSFAQGKENEIDEMRMAVQAKCNSNREARLAREARERDEQQQLNSPRA